MLLSLLQVEPWRRLLAADVLLDGPLRDRLSDGSIRLLKASWLLDACSSNPHLYRDPRTGDAVMGHGSHSAHMRMASCAQRPLIA